MGPQAQERIKGRLRAVDTHRASVGVANGGKGGRRGSGESEAGRPGSGGRACAVCADRGVPGRREARMAQAHAVRGGEGAVARRRSGAHLVLDFDATLRWGPAVLRHGSGMAATVGGSDGWGFHGARMGGSGGVGVPWAAGGQGGMSHVCVSKVNGAREGESRHVARVCFRKRKNGSRAEGSGCSCARLTPAGHNLGTVGAGQAY